MFNFGKTAKLISWAILGSIIAWGGLVLAAAPTQAGDINASSLIELTNQARLEVGLKPLAPNHKLTQAAYRKAQDMLSRGYFAHTNPDGKPFYQWVEEESYNYLYAGENLAIDFSTSEGVTAAWLGSPSHRANIVNEHYTEIGIVALRGEWQGRETTVVVQNFGAILQDSPTVLGQALNSLAKSLHLRQDNFGSLAADVILLPSLAGRKYFDIIAKTDRPVGLAFSNPTAASIAASPITKVAQGAIFRTLLQSEASCCQNDAVFAVTAASDGARLTTPISYPPFKEIFSRLAARAWLLPEKPKDLNVNLLLGALASLLLLAAYQPQIKTYLARG